MSTILLQEIVMANLLNFAENKKFYQLMELIEAME